MIVKQGFHYFKGGMQDKGNWKQDPEVSIYAKRGENGKWRWLHNEELHSFYLSPNIVRAIKSRKLRWASHVARIKGGRGASTGNSLRHRWKTIRMYLRDIGINTRNWKLPKFFTMLDWNRFALPAIEPGIVTLPLRYGGERPNKIFLLLHTDTYRA